MASTPSGLLGDPGSPDAARPEEQRHIFPGRLNQLLLEKTQRLSLEPLQPGMQIQSSQCLSLGPGVQGNGPNQLVFV